MRALERLPEDEDEGEKPDWIHCWEWPFQQEEAAADRIQALERRFQAAKERRFRAAIERQLQDLERRFRAMVGVQKTAVIYGGGEDWFQTVEVWSRVAERAQDMERAQAAEKWLRVAEEWLREAERALEAEERRSEEWFWYVEEERVQAVERRFRAMVEERKEALRRGGEERFQTVELRRVQSMEQRYQVLEDKNLDKMMDDLLEDGYAVSRNRGEEWFEAIEDWLQKVERAQDMERAQAAERWVRVAEEWFREAERALAEDKRRFQLKMGDGEDWLSDAEDWLSDAEDWFTDAEQRRFRDVVERFQAMVEVQKPAVRKGGGGEDCVRARGPFSTWPDPRPRTTCLEIPADPNTAITEFLTKCDDYQLFQLTKFYRDRLEQAIEGGVDGVSSLLTYERHFSGQEHRKVTELVEKGNRVDSSKLLLNLVMEKGSRARRVMWESFVKMHHVVPKLDKILKEIQELGPDPFDYMNIGRGLSEIPSHVKDVQQKHKETLRVQTETLRVNTILIKEKVKIFQLVSLYTELTVISTVRDRTLVEHELLARGRDNEEWREKHLRRELEKIRTDQLFQSSLSQRESKSGSSAAVSGVAGIGKTTMVQKIVYDWATGKIYPHFQFVFSFKFRDLNAINCRINLRNLILDLYPYLRNILGELWKNPEGLLFIFDGLDEFKDSIDFADNRRNTEPQYMCTDPEDQCEVSDIVYSLIQHKLLPGCSVLVTSRPTALRLLEKAEISVWAEILGFVGEERKEYFNKFFEDQAVAAAVFKHVEENEILYTMCCNPSYCCILGLSLGPFFTQRDRKQHGFPRTITQLYSYYIYNILKNHGREIESPRDVLLKIGEMAFTGVSEKKIVFRNGDLIKYNLQPSQFLSGFMMELLERDDSAQSVVYTFPHLTIQEFVAALAQFLTPDPGDIGKLLSEAHSKEDGRFEIFLRFVVGLSSSRSARPLEEFLGPFCHQTICGVIDWVKEKVEGEIGNTESETGKRDLLNTFHYLFESQNQTLARVTVGSVEIFTFSGLRLTPIDCAVLSHVIGLCDEIKHLDLQYCTIQCEGLQRLGPVLHKCQVLRLGSNKLGDSGVKPLSAALRKPDCKIQELGLDGVGLTDSCTKDLVSALSTNRSLTGLNLGSNSFTDRSVPALRSLILSCRSLEWIQLGGNRFSSKGKNQLKSLQDTRPGLSVTV
ncbi:NACHT, LRR and PYD domains-containing protein 3-like [Heptranchias perlo]|uniref:NACHT, LRR and PYD domains-containing protein 3-like n=1 Tax=Heptranchias perlo TaxID=212740 RepID=UPI00355A58B4